MELYDAIDNQTRSAKSNYDEPKIKKQLEKLIDTDSFPVIKNYLFHLILDTLCSYFTNDLSAFMVQQMIQKATLLNMKQLTHPALQLICKAKQECFKNELFPETLQALEMERKIIEVQDVAVFEKLMTDNLAEEKNVLEKHTNLMEYVHLHSKMVTMYRTNVIVRHKQDIIFFRKMLQHPLLKNESSALSFRAKYYFCTIKVICFSYLDDMEESYKCAQKLIALFESVPMRSAMINLYISSLHKMAMAQSYLDKNTDAMQSIMKIKDIGKSYPQFAKSILPGFSFRYSVVMEIGLYVYFADYETGVAQVPRIESDLKKFGHTLPKRTLHTLYYNITLLCFGVRDYHKALYWLNKILNENKNEYELDLVCGAKILFLIIHIEMGNDDLLEYAARTTERYLTNRKRKYKVESIFLDLLKIILNPDRRKDMPKIYPQMLAQFKKLSVEPYEKGAFEYIDYISWLEGKISGRSFAEVLKEKAKGVGQ